MRIFVSAIYKDSPEQNFQLKDGDLYVQFLWVPRGLNCEIGVVDSVGQSAVDGDPRMQHYVETTAHRALLQMLIADFKQVFGSGWAKALRGLVDREESRDAKPVIEQKPTLEQIAWVFDCLIKSQGTYRHLLEVMGVVDDPHAYEKLLAGLEINNALAKEAD